MNLYYKGNLVYPNARAVARGLGVSLVEGLNQVPDAKGRELLKACPEAFDAGKAVEAAANKKAIAEAERKAKEAETEKSTPQPTPEKKKTKE